jgi:2',3'-cyclic-nucleotide 2'-phosphodiesterase / 3'-nucleotidase
MHILPFDYVTRLPSVTMGLARTASLIRAARAEAANTLLFDNGDFLHGNPMGDAIVADIQRGQREPRGHHPIIAAMRAVGVDAITLGNHDFDHGVEFLSQVLATAPFPVVVSNLSLRPETDADGPRPAPSAQPFTILERDLVDDAGAPHRLRIGLLGFLPPGSITGLRGGPFRPETRDIVETARIMVPQLRALGADLVVVLAHSGIGADSHTPGMENAVVPLAEVPGIDAIVAGHAHQVFPDPAPAWPAAVDPARGTVHGTPVVIPGFWGSHLGVIDLALKPGTRGGWAVAGAQVEVRPITALDPATGALRATVVPDRRILRMLDRLHATFVTHSDDRLGETRRRLHSYFAAVAPSPAIDVVHRAQAWWTARAVAGTALAALPLVSSSAPFKTGGLAGPGYYTDIPPGPITRRALADLYLYPNDLCGLRLTGAELTDWLERAASVFNRIEPGGGDQLLLAADTPVYNFETVAGCDYTIDLTVTARYSPDGTLRDPAAGRIRDLSYQGQPLGRDDELLLITNTFRASGGGKYPLPGPERIVLDVPTGIRDIIADYLAASGPHDAEPWARWRFAPVPGAAALFRSAPDATTDPGAIGAAKIGPGSIGPDGFRCYRLAL